jgi:hypothetical protein
MIPMMVRVVEDPAGDIRGGEVDQLEELEG